MVIRPRSAASLCLFSMELNSHKKWCDRNKVMKHIILLNNTKT